MRFRPLVALAGLLIVTPTPSRAVDPVCPGSIPSLSVNDHGLIYSLAAFDDLVVTTDQRGITTWTVADPTNPTQLGHLEIAPEWLIERSSTTWSPRRHRLVFHPSGEWACISETLDCFDLRDPTTPKPYRWIADRWPCNEGSSDCTNLTFSLDRVAVRGGTGIWLADVSENSPTEWVSPEAWAHRFDQYTAFTFAGDLLLMLDGDRHLSAWDLTDPAHPIEVGTDVIDTELDRTNDWRLYGYEGGALAEGGHYDLHLVAISTKSLPDIASLDVSDRFHWESTEEIQFVGNRGVALTREWDGQSDEWIYRLQVIWANSPYWWSPGPSVEVTTTTMAVTSSHVITMPRTTHLEVYHTGVQITLEGSTPAVGEAIDLAVEGNIGVVANGRAGIAVLDLTDPERPIIRSTLEIEDAVVEQVELQDSIAFLRTGTGLATVDVSRPAAPRLLIHREFDRICCELHVNGDVAAVGSNDSCKWSLIDISNPEIPRKLTDAYYCEPGESSRWLRRIDIIDDIAYLHESNFFLYQFDISDPRQPIRLAEYYDYNFRRAQPTRDHIFAIFDRPELGSCVHLCSFASDGSFVVGRVYDDILANAIDSPGAGLIATSTSSDWSLIDFGNLVEPVVYPTPPLGSSLPMGRIVDDVWIRPFRHRLDLVSLECLPPDASFRWTGTELGIWFEDTSHHQVTERQWDFGDGATSTERSPFHRFTQRGRYRVSLTVSSAHGSDTATRLVDLLGVKPHSGPAQQPTAD